MRMLKKKLSFSLAPTRLRVFVVIFATFMKDDIKHLFLLIVVYLVQDLSTGCMEAVNEFSFCMGREHVDQLVAIHLNAISGVTDRQRERQKERQIKSGGLEMSTS